MAKSRKRKSKTTTTVCAVVQSPGRRRVKRKCVVVAGDSPYRALGRKFARQLRKKKRKR